MASSIVPFSLELAQSLYESTEKFPIDLDDAWQWLGYAKKQNAKDTLLSYFKEKRDFVRCGVKSSSGGRSSEFFKLSTNCFKEFGMISRTEKGEQVRCYFLQCEDYAKRAMILIPQLQSRVDFLESQLGDRAPKCLPMSDETRAQMAMRLSDDAKVNNDKRLLITANAAMANMLMPDNVPQDLAEELLSVTEICERHGIRIPQGKDSAIGRKVAKLYREEKREEPQTCAKHIGTGHRTADIKIYPQDFFERIVAIAQEYL